MVLMPCTNAEAKKSNHGNHLSQEANLLEPDYTITAVVQDAGLGDPV